MAKADKSGEIQKTQREVASGIQNVLDVAAGTSGTQKEVTIHNQILM